MRKKDIIDLITAHYEGDNRLFFQKTIEILKEFKADGDDALIAHMDFLLKSNVKIAQKREEPKFDPEISFEDAEDLGWFVPQEEPDYSVCPKCGGTNIVWNKSISDPFIKCNDCGHYLRPGYELGDKR